jgi:hypothetical protein
MEIQKHCENIRFNGKLGKKPNPMTEEMTTKESIISA